MTALWSSSIANRVVPVPLGDAGSNGKKTSLTYTGSPEDMVTVLEGVRCCEMSWSLCCDGVAA